METLCGGNGREGAVVGAVGRKIGYELLFSNIDDLGVDEKNSILNATLELVFCRRHIQDSVCEEKDITHINASLCCIFDVLKDKANTSTKNGAVAAYTLSNILTYDKTIRILRSICVSR